jgi:hypothetical protein
MPMQVIVSPAMAASDRRPPERSAPNTADDAARHSADRASDQEAGSRAGTGADPISTSRRRGHDYRGRKNGRCKQKLSHMFVPRLYCAPHLWNAATHPTKQRIA